MAHPKCPHCSEEIEKLPGFVAEATLKERLKRQAEAKDGEISALTSRVTELEGRTEGHDAIVSERDTLKAELAGLKQRGERTAALSELKLDPGLLEHVEVLYNSATAGQDEPPEFKAWLEGDGKAHPLLAPHVGKAPSTATGTGGTGTGGAAGTGATGAGAAAGVGTGANRLPDTGTGGDPPAPGGKMTPEQLRQYFAGPEFAALDRDGKRAKIAELKGQVAHADPAGR